MKRINHQLPNTNYQAKTKEYYILKPLYVSQDQRVSYATVSLRYIHRKRPAANQCTSHLSILSSTTITSTHFDRPKHRKNKSDQINRSVTYLCIHCNFTRSLTFRARWWVRCLIVNTTTVVRFWHGFLWCTDTMWYLLCAVYAWLGAGCTVYV